MKNNQDSFIISVSGLKYHLNDNEAPLVNDNVVLIPENNNIYDKNAIAVYDVLLQKKLGYIPKTSGANIYIGNKINWQPFFLTKKLQKIKLST